MGFEEFETAINEFLCPREIGLTDFKDMGIVGTKPTTPTAESRAAVTAAVCVMASSVVGSVSASLRELTNRLCCV